MYKHQKKSHMQIHKYTPANVLLRRLPETRGEVSGQGQALLNPDPNPSSYRRKIYKLLIKIRRGKSVWKKSIF